MKTTAVSVKGLQEFNHNNNKKQDTEDVIKAISSWVWRQKNLTERVWSIKFEKYTHLPYREKMKRCYILEAETNKFVPSMCKKENDKNQSVLHELQINEVIFKSSTKIGLCELTLWIANDFNLCITIIIILIIISSSIIHFVYSLFSKG